MSEQDDQIFLKRFSLIIVGLMIFAVFIIFLAVSFHNTLGTQDNPARLTSIADRLKPVAGVYSGDTGRAAAQAAAEQSGPAEEEQSLAFDGSTDGEMIYQQACAACHDAGAAGAPRLVASDWTERMDKGTDALVANAINGIGAMPAKGGRADLSDEQVRASVEYMLDALE